MEAKLPCCYADTSVLAPALLFAFSTGMDRDTGRDRDTARDRDVGRGVVSDLQAQAQAQDQTQSEIGMSWSVSDGFTHTHRTIGIQVT